jgi:putative spermidine/putrescine transport system ATP-binding protein
VARFMGGQNVLTGTVAAVSSGKVRASTPEGWTCEMLASTDHPLTQGAPVSFAIRRDRVGMRKRTANDPSGSANSIPGVVDAIEYQGSYVKVTVNIGQPHAFVANISDAAYFTDPAKGGDAVTVSWQAEDVHVLSKADTGDAGVPYLDAAP